MNKLGLLLLAFVGVAISLIVLFQSANEVTPVPQEVTQKKAPQPDHFTLALTDQAWSDPVRVSGTKCIRWWGDSSLMVQVRGVNDSTWYKWSEWRRLTEAKEITYNFGWVTFRSSTPTGIANYEILNKGQCT